MAVLFQTGFSQGSRVAFGRSASDTRSRPPKRCFFRDTLPSGTPYPEKVGGPGLSSPHAQSRHCGLRRLHSYSVKPQVKPVSSGDQLLSLSVLQFPGSFLFLCAFDISAFSFLTVILEILLLSSFARPVSIRPGTQHHKGENWNRGPLPMTCVPTPIPEPSRPRADVTGRGSFYFYFRNIRNCMIKLSDDFIPFPLTEACGVLCSPNSSKPF